MAGKQNNRLQDNPEVYMHICEKMKGGNARAKGGNARAGFKIVSGGPFSQYRLQDNPEAFVLYSKLRAA